MAKKAAAPMTNKDRRDAVEAEIRKSGWCEATIASLVASTGWSRRTLYRERDRLAATLAQEEAAGIEERRALFLLDLRRVREASVADRNYSPAIRAMDMESKILGLDRVPLPVLDEDANAIVDTSLEAILVEVRRMRRSAQAGHSYTVAGALLEREHGIVNDIRVRDEATAAANLTHLDESTKVAMVTQVLQGLPLALQKQVLEAIKP